MTINLVARRIDGLPPLAWIAVLPKDGAGLELLHGSNVELFPQGFFEGAWDGPFAEAGFDAAANVFGSGGRIGTDTVIFVGPSHTLEPLYIGRTDRLSAVSNSLAFLLHHCGLTLDLWNFRYGAAFSAIVGGLQHTPQEIALQGGTLTLFYHHNATLVPDGTLTVTPKPLPPSFRRYEEYRDYLQAVAGRVFGNAADPARRSRYRPISTISSGYDSAAAAAIAKSCGCAETISLATSSRGLPDSGRAVAEALGLRHTEFERPSRATDAGLSEAEFLAPGMQGEDLVYGVFEENLRGRILTTGFMGGTNWDKTHEPSADIGREDLSGCSLGEFRLRANFLHLPVIFIAAQRGPDVHRIANAPEMAAYSVGGGYDRPVPRRILEEAGVPRPLFGQAKRAASILLFQGRNRLSPGANARIKAHCGQEGAYLPYLLVVLARTAWWTIGRNIYRLSHRLRKLLKAGRRSVIATVPARICAALFGIEAPVFGASHPRFTLLLTWAVAEIEDRYTAAGRHPLARSGRLLMRPVRTNNVSRFFGRRRGIRSTLGPDRVPTQRAR